MSNPPPNPEPKPHEAPELLRAADTHQDWRCCLDHNILDIAQRFAGQFRLELEEAVAALFLTVSHSLGESLRIDLPNGDLTPPFNLLVITPEVAPVWTGVPLRYLSRGIEKQVEHRLLRERMEEQAGKKDEAAIRGVLPEQWAQKVNETAGLQILRQIADTLVCDQLRPPFTRSPLDHAVSLTTPRRGLVRTLGELTPLERVYLEDSLLGVRCLREGNPAPGPPARPSFFWQVPQAQSCTLFRQHGHWLKEIPFVMLQCHAPGFPCLDTDASVIRQFDKLSEILFKHRHARSGNPHVLRLESNVAKPVMKFIDLAARQQGNGAESSVLKWVADLGLKFAMILMKLQEATKLDLHLVENGLELAKFYARRRVEILSAFTVGRGADCAETADLDGNERRAFLKICEAGGITRADLRKSFHKLSSSERDAVVARLLERGLVRAENGLLWPYAAG